MKKHSGTILLVLIFFVGLAVMLYPTISDYINQRNQTRVVNSYAQQVDGLSDADYTAYFDAADVFNQEIAADPDALYHADRFSTYSTTLDVTGTGIMGYITIPRIGVELPIYHGTSDAVLQVAAGHLEGTSLPVGGESTHAVISAHRGLPSAKLFTHLDRLEVGDTFTITVLDRELTYEVDKISIVLPTEVDELKVVDGKDYVTLMTCTPTASTPTGCWCAATASPPRRTSSASVLQLTPPALSPSSLRRCWPCRCCCFCSSACWSPAENANRNDKSRLKYPPA